MIGGTHLGLLCRKQAANSDLASITGLVSNQQCADN